MKNFEHRSEGRDFFEMTRADFFTEESNTSNKWLREFRQELDLTLSQLGELVGVNKIQVWKWETGRVNPPKSALICTLFLKIIRSIGDRELRLATYPVNRREKLLLKSKKLDLIKDNLLRSQTEEVYRKAARLMKEELS